MKKAEQTQEYSDHRHQVKKGFQKVPATPHLGWAFPTVRTLSCGGVWFLEISELVKTLDSHQTPTVFVNSYLSFVVTFSIPCRKTESKFKTCKWF